MEPPHPAGEEERTHTQNDGGVEKVPEPQDGAYISMRVVGLEPTTFGL
jgi:hypothetical protein